MRSTTLFVRVLLAVGLLGTAGKVANAQSITGVVTDADRNALSSMVASAYAADPSCSTRRVVCWANVANSTTDTLGRFSLSLAAGRTYRVLAYDPTGVFATQFSGNAESFDVTPQTAVPLTGSATVNFALTRGGTLTGIALTSGGTRPDIVVAAYNPSGTRRGYARTGANGVYSMVLPPGTYKLVAYDETGTFATAFFRDRQDFSGADSVSVLAARSETGLDVFLPIGARFTGVVRDASGAPIDGATVYAYTAAGKQALSAYTTADGTFSMTLAGGTYRFAAADESRVYAAGFLNDAPSFDSSPTLTVSAGQSRSDLTFALQVGGKISGTVTDGRNAATLAGATVAAYNTDGSLRSSTTTDASGRYELLLPTASFVIAAWNSNLEFAPQFYPLRSAYRHAVPVATSPNSLITLPPFALHQAGHVLGTVREPNGSPVGSLIVAAYDSDGATAASAPTDSLGRFRLGLGDGAYRLLVYDPRFQYGVAYDRGTSYDSIPPRIVSAGQDQTVDFTVFRGTRVSGTITDSAGRPVAGIEVTAFDPAGGRIANARTENDGSFDMALLPGQYRFGARDPVGRYAAAFLGGPSLDTASLIAVSATGAPAINVTLRVITHRRAVRR